jgi:hypothetical protein
MAPPAVELSPDLRKVSAHRGPKIGSAFSTTRSRTAKHHHGAVANIDAIANEGTVSRPGLQPYLGDETLFEAGPGDQETGDPGQSSRCQFPATSRGNRQLQADLVSQRRESCDAVRAYTSGTTRTCLVILSTSHGEPLTRNTYEWSDDSCVESQKATADVDTWLRCLLPD